MNRINSRPKVKVNEKNYIVVDMRNGHYVIAARSDFPGVDYVAEVQNMELKHARWTCDDWNKHFPRKGTVVTAIMVLFLALSGMAQTNNVVVRVEPSYHMVGSLTMLDGRVYQAQEATLFTNYESVIMFEGQPHTNLLKSVQGVTLTNFADLKFVRTDAPVMPPLPPKLPK